MQHGFWCGARTIPMPCRYCGANLVFWFSCECGCSVVWDELGWPWPKHPCFTRRSTGVVESVSQDVLAVARMSWTTNMSAVAPQHAGQEIITTGIVGNLVPERNIEKKFGVADTPSGRSLLGPLANYRPGTITVHAIRGSSDGHPPRRESLTAWTSRTKLRSLGLGDPVRIRAEAREVMDELIWVVGSLKPVFPMDA